MARKKPKQEKDVIDQILDSIDFRGLTQNEVAGKDGLIKQLSGRILQRALDAEMTHHLGYEKNSNAGDNSPYMARGNSRNGHTEKTVLLENQSTVIQVPRDRNSTFEPEIIPKHEKRLPEAGRQTLEDFGESWNDAPYMALRVFQMNFSPHPPEIRRAIYM